MVRISVIFYFRLEELRVNREQLPNFKIFFCPFPDLCGAQGATQGIGFLLGLTSIPITVGPPIAGFLYDQTKSYRMSFIMAGIPAIIGAILMTLIRCMRDERVDACDKQTDSQLNKLLNKPAWTESMFTNYAYELNVSNRGALTFPFDQM